MTTSAKSDLRKKREAFERSVFWGWCVKLVLLCVGLEAAVLLVQLVMRNDAPPKAAAESNHRIPDKPATPLPKAELSPDFRGDEAYLLTRLLENCYEQWPADISDPDSFFYASHSMRVKARRLQTRAERMGFKSIANLFGDYLQQLDAYIAFLERLGAIQSRAYDEATRVKRDAAKQSIGGMIAGVGSGSASTLGGVAASAAMAGLNYAFEAWAANEARDSKLVDATRREVRQMSDRYQINLEKARDTIVTLGVQRGWKRGELGWVPVAGDSPQASATQDIPALARELSRLSALRPRDPLVRFDRNATLAWINRSQADELQKITEDSFDAANLFPDVDAYAEYRAYYVYFASVTAALARHAELADGAALTKRSPISVRALELAEYALRMDPSDATGVLRLSVAVAHLGQGRGKEARTAAENLRPIFGADAIYQRALASIYAQNQQWEEALVALRLARDGGQPAQDFFDNWYLQPLRKARKAQFDKIIIPQWSWDIVYGFFDDDVRLKNDSLYPLTSVRLNIQLQQNDLKWERNLEVPSLQPGEIFVWENVVAIPGSRLTKSEATLRCDQNGK